MAPGVSTGPAGCGLSIRDECQAHINTWLRTCLEDQNEVEVEGDTRNHCVASWSCTAISDVFTFFYVLCLASNFILSFEEGLVEQQRKFTFPRDGG